MPGGKNCLQQLQEAIDQILRSGVSHSAAGTIDNGMKHKGMCEERWLVRRAEPGQSRGSSHTYKAAADH